MIAVPFRTGELGNEGKRFYVMEIGEFLKDVDGGDPVTRE